MFQDALEDAHYTRALQIGRLDPSRPLPVIEINEIEKHINELLRTEPQSLELECICQQPLGFYLVSFLPSVYFFLYYSIKIFFQYLIFLSLFSLQNF
jgi:hypothetical protein